MKQAIPVEADHPPSLRRRLFSSNRRARRKTIHLPDHATRVLQALVLGTICLFALILSVGAITQLACFLIDGVIYRFGLPLQLTTQPFGAGHLLSFQRIALTASMPPPDSFALTLHAIFTGGIFFMSWAARSRPWRSGLQMLCVVHGITLLMCALPGAQLPFDLAQHTRTLADLSVILLLSTPLVLASGYYIVERSWLNRIAATTLILIYQISALPLKLLVHALLVTQLSSATIPLLFFAAGPALDVLLLSALYGWVITWKMPDDKDVSAT